MSITPESFKASGVSIRDAAARTGISRPRLHRWLHGGSRITTDEAAALEQVVTGKQPAPPLPRPPGPSSPDADPVQAAARSYEISALEAAAGLLSDANHSLRLQAAKLILSYARGRPGQHVADEEPGAPADREEVLAKFRAISASMSRARAAEASMATTSEPPDAEPD
jgi:transcriptional regulator with XRE-family HTH domain